MVKNGASSKVVTMNFRRFRRLTGFVPRLVIALLIFGAGLGVGSGQIRFGQEAGFRKPVQAGLPADLDYSDVEALYDNLKATFDGELNTETLTDGLKEGLVRATGDPYTE